MIKSHSPNPFHIDKYFDDVKGKRIDAQEAINLTSVLAQNKVDMYRMIKNAGVTNIKELYMKCQKNFERITKQSPKANILATYAMKRPKQDIQHSKVIVEPRKNYLRKADSTGKMTENERRPSMQRTNQRDYYEKVLNIAEGDNSKLVDDVIQMMIVMAEYIQTSQEYEDSQQLIKKSTQMHRGEHAAEPKPKRKSSIPQIRIIVSSPPKEIQSQPDILMCDDEILELSHHSKDSPNARGRKRIDDTKYEDNQEKSVEYPEFTGYSSNTSINEEDDAIPEDMPLSIITSTLGRLSLSSFDVGRISGHIREHIVQL